AHRELDARCGTNAGQSIVHLHPVGPAIVAAKYTLVRQGGVEAVGVAGITDQEAGAAIRKIQFADLVDRSVRVVIKAIAGSTRPGDERKGVAAVGASIHATAVYGRHQNDLVGEAGSDRGRHDAPHPLAAKLAANRDPGVSSVSG